MLKYKNYKVCTDSKRYIFFIKAIAYTLLAWLFLMPMNVKAKDPLVIVLDPGHGGDNLGAEYDGYTEKDMTIVVARAMKEELEKYDNVKVYLTRETDESMSIKDRAAFAGERNADFLFCLHFNSSLSHTLYGAEVWVPASGEYYAKGYSFAQIQMNEFTELGLYSRGIKTRLNDRDENYYGILRYCTYEGVPSALIEHCHIDQEKDRKFFGQGKEQLEELGRLDAVAVAKYFGLKSEILGIDYSDYPVPKTDIPKSIVRPDKSEPELCQIEVTQINEETGEVTVQMEAVDSDSYILYYNYSLDGGNTYSLLEEWPRPDAWNRSDKSHCFTVTVPFNEEIELRASAYNGFDVWTESNIVTIDPIIDPEKLKQLKEELLMQYMPEVLRPSYLKDSDRRKEELRKEQETAMQDVYEEMMKDEENARVSIEENVKDAENAKFQDEKEEDKAKNIPYVLVMIAFIAVCMVAIAFYMAKMLLLLIASSKKR